MPSQLEMHGPKRYPWPLAVMVTIVCGLVGVRGRITTAFDLGKPSKDLLALLGLTADEFRVEGDLVAIGPVYDAEAFTALLDELEKLGLTYFDDYFELSGNWPAWVAVLVGSSTGPGRSNPSQPHS